MYNEEDLGTLDRSSLSHVRTPVKTGVPIWDTDKKPVWSDKAGGYGIQDPFGMKYIKRIEGDYYNVVGLPISRLYQELKKMNVI